MYVITFMAVKKSQDEQDDLKFSFTNSPNIKMSVLKNIYIGARK